MKKKQIKLTENELRELIKESVSNVLKEMNGEYTLADALELLNDMYENIQSTIQEIPQSEINLTISLREIEHIKRIIRNNM